MSVFLRGPHARETVPGAHQLDELVPPPVPTLSIWSPDDPFVVPSSSALPEGVESVRLDGAGHLELLISARLLPPAEGQVFLPALAKDAELGVD